MNTVLQGLTKLIPDHSLMWSYNINSSLAHCGHRTFYSHLVFFLEGLVFRWANHCSSAQINISFESHGTIDYYDPQANNIRSIYHKASDTNALGAAVHSIMNTAMLNNTLNAYHNYIHNVQADEATPVYDPNLINWNDSKNDKALSKGPDPMTASKSSITAFNVDEYVFNYDDVGSTATDSVGADVAQLEAMNSSIDIGAIIDRAKDSSSESDRLDTARTRNPSFQAESDSRSLHCTTDDVGSGSLDANSGIDGSGDGTDSIYGAGRMKLNLKIDTDVEPVNKDKGHIQYGYLRILFQPLDLVMDEEGGISSKNESSLPQSIGGFATNISPLLNTAELMRVLGDFLYEIDTKAVVSLAPKHFMRTLPEPNSIAFMIVLPCYFKITEKERAPSTAKESAVIAGMCWLLSSLNGRSILCSYAIGGSCINMSSLGLAPSSTELANNTNRKMSRAKRIVRNSSKKNGRMSTVDEADEDDEQLKCLSSSGSQSFITRRRGAPASDWRSESGKSNKSGSSKMRRKRSQGQMHKSGSKTSDGLNSSESKSMLQTIAFTVPPQLTPSQVMKSTESLARSVTKSLVSFRTSIRGQGSADELNGSTAIVPSGKPSSNADLLQGTHPSSISSVASNHVVHPSRSVITSLLSSFNFSSLYHSMFRSNSVQPT